MQISKQSQNKTEKKIYEKIGDRKSRIDTTKQKQLNIIDKIITKSKASNDKSLPGDKSIRYEKYKNQTRKQTSSNLQQSLNLESMLQSKCKGFQVLPVFSQRQFNKKQSKDEHIYNKSVICATKMKKLQKQLQAIIIDIRLTVKQMISQFHKQIEIIKQQFDAKLNQKNHINKMMEDNQGYYNQLIANNFLHSFGKNNIESKHFLTPNLTNVTQSNQHQKPKETSKNQNESKNNQKQQKSPTKSNKNKSKDRNMQLQQELQKIQNIVTRLRDFIVQ